MNVGRAAAPRRSRGPVTPPAWLRALDVTAGLLSAGVLVVGVVLLGFQLFAPTIWAAMDLGGATGPGWGLVVSHLAVGAGGELAVALRRRWAMSWRAAVDVAVIVATGVLVVRGWWP